MKRLPKILISTMAAFTLLAGLAAGPAEALDKFLRAEKTCLTLPEGTYTAPVAGDCPDAAIAMWAYAECTDGTFTSCLQATVPGPEIRVTLPDTLTVNIQNTLPVTTSVFIPGQLLSNNTGPVWLTDTALPYTGATVSGNRPGADVTSRVRSFAHEAAATNGTATYQWNNLRPGSYLYESGTHPALQVQMGLYGAVIVDSAAGQAYGGVAYDKDIVVLYSEIDPDVHTAADTIAPDDPPSTNTYEPRYFLVNGKGYTTALSPLVAGTAGQATLLRFLNAGLDTHNPMIQNTTMTAVAEDGHLYANRRASHVLQLPAGKTKDVLLSPTPAAGYYPLYDRRLNLTNNAEPLGGMLSYLEVPDAQQFALTVVKNVANVATPAAGTVSTVSAPGGIFCDTAGLDCSQSYNVGAVVALSATAAPGYRFTGWLINGVADAACPGTADCVVTVDAAKAVTANFAVLAGMRVLSPNGGQVYAAGDYVAIEWSGPASATKFTLQYSLNNGATWQIIAANVTGNSYNWLLPNLGRQRTACKVRVIGFNAGNARVGADASDKPFAIKMVRLYSPNGAESWQSNTQQTIVWDTFGIDRPVARVNLDYTINGGVTWKPIARLTTNPGVHTWTVPVVAAPKAKSRVRVTLRNAAGVVMSSDVSDAFFTITP